MVVGAFPAAKLGALLLRQISKPIATYLKEQAKASPVFRTYVCMPPAHIYNWCEVTTKMWVLKMGTPVNIPVLNEAMAIELGANLLGEAIIFIIAAGILINEYARSSRKEAAKEAAKQQEIDSLNNEVKELFFVVEEQRAQLKELLRVVGDLDSYAVKMPRWSSQPDKSINEPQVEERRPPPPPSSTPVLSLPHSDINETSSKTVLQNKDNQTSGILLQAAEVIESDFFYHSRESKLNLGILSVALNYIHKDVLRKAQS